MRKSKKSKILSLMLCMSMILSTFTFTSGAVFAEETGTTAASAEQQPTEPTDNAADSTDETTSTDSTKSSQQDTDKNDITKMTVKEQFEYLASLKTDAERKAEIEKLSEAQREALQAYVEEQSENSDAADTKDSATVSKTVDFTDVAPFLDPVVGKSSTVKSLKKSAKLMTAKLADFVSAVKTAAAANVSEGSERVDNDGIVTSKTAAKNADGTYKIRLESYVTGSTTSSTVTETIPTDIVLVLDQSGSMAESFGYKYNEITGYPKYNEYYYQKANPSSYSSSTPNLWYKLDNGEYVEVKVQRAGEWELDKYTYTYTYTYNGKTTTLGTSTGVWKDPGYTFYTKEKDTSTTKLAALKNAVTSFSNSVAEKTKGADGQAGTSDDVNHRIAIVGFGSDGDSRSYYYTNTELFNGSTQIRYDQLKKSDYESAFQDMSTSDGQSKVKASIGALAAEGATRADLGMDMAQNVLTNNPVEQGTKRNRVVIMFTDGSPTSSNGFELNVANNAISKAGDIKDAGTTVYSVGIFDGADAGSTGSKPNRDLDGDSSSLPAACNWFMQNLSSNNGNVNIPSYYLSASDSTALNKIFEEISKQIDEGGADVKLDSTTVVKDIVSDYFELPEGTDASKITLKTADFDGYESDGKTPKWKTEVDASGVTASIDNKTLNVTGFDFSANYVGIDEEKTAQTKTPRGKKLIIEFNVKARDGFLGGNGVPTNGADSGIYTKKDGADTVMENFEQPTVDVPISEIAAKASDKNVYLDGSLDASDIRSGVTVKAGNSTLDLTKENYGLESWQNAFVDISVSAKDKAGNDIFADGYEGMKNLTADDSYTVEASIKAKSDSEGKSASANGNVNVFKPELTYKDSIVYYGDKAPESYDGNKVGGTVWKHGDKTSTEVTMTGDAPTLDISYNPAIGDGTYYKDGKISTKQDIPVKATVKIGDKDVTGHVTFKHNDCNPACGFDSTKEQFLIHVKTCSLTVKKTGGVSGEPYVMNIYKDGAETPYTSLTIVGNAEKTVKELPVGTYTVQEDTNWAWRYSETAPEITPADGINLSKDKTSDKITVKNQNRYGSFLNGYSTVVKNTFGESN